MRIAVLILGLLLGLLMFFQALIGYVVGSATSSDDLAGAGALGLLVALMWLLACALVIAFPLVSAIILGLAMPIAWGSAALGYTDMWIWSGASFVLAVMAFFGWRGKVKDRREAEAERMRQAKRDAMLEHVMRQQMSSNPVQARPE
ncbi:MAG TPA: hypothetical protein VNZ58_03670 [Thermomicrobiales bacterium]|nr:hypothetical protein [Thermomicrobiales bacterium]